MSYVLINRAEDGTHTHVFRSKARALTELAEFLGRDTDDWGKPFTVGKTYCGDWGNRLTVEYRPAGHTAAKEDALRRAYDARECGVATKRQLALLEREGF